MNQFVPISAFKLFFILQGSGNFVARVLVLSGAVGFFSRVHSHYKKTRGHSHKGLKRDFSLYFSSRYNNLLQHCRELDSWAQDLTLPSVVWISGFFNPQSFLTAVVQNLARKNEWPLDKMHITIDVTKKYKEDFTQPAREGAYIHGLYMEGARWDIQGGHIAEACLKAPTQPMPVIFVRAIPNDRQETRNIYDCPVYKTKLRGDTYVSTFHLKTKEKPAKWILAGVALLLSV